MLIELDPNPNLHYYDGMRYTDKQKADYMRSQGVGIDENGFVKPECTFMYSAQPYDKVFIEGEFFTVVTGDMVLPPNGGSNYILDSKLPEVYEIVERDGVAFYDAEATVH